MQTRKVGISANSDSRLFTANTQKAQSLLKRASKEHAKSRR